MSKDAMYLRKSRVDLEAERHGAGDTLARHKQASWLWPSPMG